MSARAQEGFLRAGAADLYYREIGEGRPILVLHGGPDFDYSYFLPGLDRLADSFRLLYYAQRGRGKSSRKVQPDDVNLDSEIEDIEVVRRHFRYVSVAVLGHSWGGLLAMEYAIRHPGRQSHLILMNTGPASHDDYELFRSERRRTVPDDMEKLKELSATPDYIAGERQADADYYRVHFAATLRDPTKREELVRSLRAHFDKESILKARRIEDRLMDETWLASDYNLIPKLEGLRVPTLVVHGDHDFVPVACAERIAQAIPGARFVLLKDCGHFAYIDQPARLQEEIAGFLAG